MFDWDDSVTRVYRAAEGENCLRVNVWTPGTNDGAKRPVMVWLHGGGFTNGSGNEQPSYDGENLARRGDVVVVTLNHRLNVFGYLNLAKYGEKYRQSANVGMLDIVAALEWVRDNIGAFGGDPRCVTIFGQSGGGSKVSALMAMPSAKGLFHRAIVQSGSMLKAGSTEKSALLADLIVADLGLTAATIDTIQELPFEQIQTAADLVLQKYNDRKEPDGKPVEHLGFGPVVDGDVLPAHPFSPAAPLLSAEVPMIVGTTLNEFVHGINQPDVDAMTDDELLANVRKAFGDKDAASIIAAFRKRTPSAKPFDLWSRISATSMRGRAVAQCQAKAELGRAPAYLYWFSWFTPVFGGRPRAFHCAEIPFVFYNTDRCETMTGGGSDARALAAKITDAWIHFARTGDPNHPGLPAWPAFDIENAPTMIFDNECVVENYPDREELASVGPIS
jgi:para-nitrobenzyl esterase